MMIKHEQCLTMSGRVGSLHPGQQTLAESEAVMKAVKLTSCPAV